MEVATIKRTQASVESRRESILASIRSSGIVNVKDLAVAYRVSELTIRRDLEVLAQAGKLERFHGGAIASGNAEAAGKNALGVLGYKHALAQKAAELVEDNNTIFINSSSTALLLLKYITAANVTIITNNAKALFAVRPRDSTIIFTGGEIRVPKDAMVGDLATSSLSRVTADKCFMGCAGIDLEHGIMSTVLPEATINQIMYTRTHGEKVLLADSSRFERVHPFYVCGIEDITHLITENSVPPRIIEPIRQLGVTVFQVKPLCKF